MTSPIRAWARRDRLLEVLFDQVRVDREGGLGTLRCRDDDPLDCTRGVTGHEQPGQMRGLVLAGAYRPLVVELAAKLDRERRLLVLAGGEEQRPAFIRRSAVEHHPFENAVLGLEP